MKKHGFSLVGLGLAAMGCTPPALPLSLSSSPPAEGTPAGATSEPAARSAMACSRGEAVEVLGGVYCAIDAPSSWAGANARCAEYNGELARIGSRVEEVALRAAVASPVAAQTLWIDLRRGSEGWQWGDDSARLEATQWMAGEPNDAGGNERCGEWSTSSGRWNDLTCEADRAVLCEVSNLDACGAEGVQTAHGRYCLYPRAMLSQGQARVLCARIGGELAKLETATENEALRQTLGAWVGAERVWVGLSDVGQEGRWLWSGQLPVTHGWLPGEPNDAGGGEDCGEWWPQTGGFNDLPCERQLPALCEIRR